MPAKKHRPIVMNRNKRPGRTYKILKKAILITAVLAIIEIIILVVIHFTKANKAVVKTEEKPKEMPREMPKEEAKVAATDTPKMAVVKPPEVIAKNKQKDSVPKKDTIQIIRPAVEKRKPKAVKPVKDTAAAEAESLSEIKVARKVSSDDMFRILNDIRMEKLQANNPAKCISIQIINSSNAENGSTIANYLRKNGYVISGREVISGNQDGVRINAEGPCIKLSIGNL